MSKLSKIISLQISRLSLQILDNPYLFNYARNILAGEQENTKSFVRKALVRYDCKNVLDVGCGTGDFAQCCNGLQYLGTDLNESFISFANKRYKNDKNKIFIKEDILTNDKYEKQKFDGVLLISMLHHFSDNDLEIILGKVKEKVNKTLIVADIIPDPPFFVQKLVAKMDQGKFVRTREEKIRILKKHFTVVESKIINSRLAVQFGVICTP